MRKKEKIIYYENELEDEFSNATIKTRKIDENYKYKAGIVRKLLRFFLYGIIMRIIAFVFLKLVYRHKIVNRKILRKNRTSFFIYGNHTNSIADAFIPSMITFPRGVYLIVHPDNVSIPVIGRLTPAFGAIPIPGNIKAARNYAEDIKEHVKRGHIITIYPEAHIWPYYTKIRPFKNDSFVYPCKYNTPAFCFTNTYQKGRFLKFPRIVTYIDGPFFPDMSISIPESRGKIRNEVFRVMAEQSKNNNVEYIKYVKKSDNIGSKDI